MRAWLTQVSEAPHLLEQRVLGRVVLVERTGPGGQPARSWMSATDVSVAGAMVREHSLTMAVGCASDSFSCSADEYLAFVLDVERYREVDDKLGLIDWVRSDISLPAPLGLIERATLGRHLQASVERELELSHRVLAA